MEDMEVDGMEADDDELEMDRNRRHRAAQKLSGRFATGAGARDANPMTSDQAKDILKHLSVLCCGNKISVNNAFSLQGIDALRTIVFSGTAKAHALCGEGHFQSAGVGLDIGIRIFEKRVDATYNITRSILGICQEGARQGDDDAEQNLEAHGGASAEGSENGGAGRGAKARKRQGAASAEATLVEDSELKQRVKEPTFDTDPFFVRTSRLIDENSPQGMLLHNLPVLRGTDVVFDPNVRPQALLAQAREGASATASADNDNDLVDLTALPGVQESLQAAASACISPGIEQLYALLQPRPDLPGLEVARKVDPEKLLRDALAENEGARAEAQRNLAVRQVVRQAENAMDIDMDAAAGSPHDAGHEQDEAWGTAGPVDGDEDLPADAGGEGMPFDGYDSPGYGGGGDDDPYNHEGSQHGRGSGTAATDDEDVPVQAADTFGNDVPGADRAASDDESALLSLLGAAASSLPGSSTTLQRTWWKSRARKTTAAAAAGTKTRVRKPKPESEPLDWRAAPEQQLEAVGQHTYKTARRDASAKLCMPLEEPARPDALRCYFSAAPAVSDLSYPVCGTGPGILGVMGGQGGVHYGSSCFSCSVQETWRALLIADYQRERQLRRGARAAAAARKSLGNAAAVGTPGASGFGGPSASATDGPYGAPDEGEEYHTAGQYNIDGVRDDGNECFDDAGLGESYGDYDDDDDGTGVGDNGSGGIRPNITYSSQDGRAPTLEELLQPPRRVRRLPVKYDKTAGVADVATLKANIEVSLKELAVSTASRRRQSAPQAASALSFQSVLDQVSAKATGGAQTSSQEANGPATSAAGGGRTGAGNGGAYSLAGVSTHLAFICLLHLANEKGLALGGSEQLDTLLITGLGDLMTTAR